MMQHHNRLGYQGEQQAVDFLLTKGYQILERNWRYGRLEIDIIAKKQEVLTIIEVKTRTTTYFGAPETFVRKKKIQHLIRAADAYIQQKQLDYEVQFDIVAIDKQNDTLNHIENAFRIV